MFLLSLFSKSSMACARVVGTLWCWLRPICIETQWDFGLFANTSGPGRFWIAIGEQMQKQVKTYGIRNTNPSFGRENTNHWPFILNKTYEHFYQSIILLSFLIFRQRKCGSWSCHASWAYIPARCQTMGLNLCTSWNPKASQRNKPLMVCELRLIPFKIGWSELWLKSLKRSDTSTIQIHSTSELQTKIFQDVSRFWKQKNLKKNMGAPIHGLLALGAPPVSQSGHWSVLDLAER